MHSPSQFQVVILPRREPAAVHCTLSEALAFQRGYHEVVEHGRQEAVIAREAHELAAGPELRSPR